MPDSREEGTVSSPTPARTLRLETTRRLRSEVAWTSVCVKPTQARNGDMAVGDPASLVLSCLLTLYTAVMSFEILFPFGREPARPRI